MKKLWKKVLAGVLVAGMMLAPVAGSGITIAHAEDATPSAGSVVYDFTDGSIIPTDTNGKSDVTVGDITIKVGTKNAYQYNGADHGVAFKAGNSIELKVGGAVTVQVGDCQYSNAESLTMTNADGTWTQTVAGKAGCWHNDGSMLVFNYQGGATTLILNFENTAYVPRIVVTPDTAVTTYDFRDGSIIPTDTNGKSDVSYGNMTVKVGTKNAYQYNGAQHGVAFKAGNSIELIVDGPSVIEVGDCQYSNAESLTMTSADGKWTQTVAGKAGCQHNDGSVLVFKYEGEATTLTLNFENTAYVPSITVKKLVAEVGDENGVPADSVFMYNFADGSVVDTSYDAANHINGTVTSKDGFLSVISEGNVYYHDKDHGLAVTNGDKIEVKVAGDAVVSFLTCEYGSSTDAYWQVKNEKGEIVSDTQQPAVRKDYDGMVSAFKYEGVATTLTFTLKTTGGEYYLHGVNVANYPKATETPVLVGNGKIDVWDFGAEQLDSSKYNNMLTAEKINGWYDDSVAAGSEGATIGSFVDGDIMFNGSSKTNNRIRTANEAITRYDAKTKKYIAEDGTETVLNGFVYSNSGSTSRVWFGIKLYEGDILTTYTSSNGGMATLSVETPSGKVFTAPSDGSNSVASKNTFYAEETGIYRLYTIDEKLVVCRVEREHTAPVLVSGKITKPESLSGYELVFTNNKTGAATTVTPDAEGNYEAWLRNSYDYTLSLANANGYVIKSDAVVTVKATGTSAGAGLGEYTVQPGDMLKTIAARYNCTIWDLVELNVIENPDLIWMGQKLMVPGAGGYATATVGVSVESVDLVTMTGKIEGLSADALAKLKLSFVNEEYAYVPEFTVSGEDITVRFERGVAYDIVAEGINDYYLTGEANISLTEDTVKNLTFAAKPVYDVTVETTGISKEAWENATITFTNIKESGYSYTFKATDKMTLRDGQYAVKVSGVGSEVAQKLTADAKVNGAAATVKVPFETLTAWDFGKLNKEFGGAGVETIGEGKYYSGLVLTGSVKENKTYLLANAGDTVQIPVKKGQTVTVSYCYCAAFDINGEAAYTVDEKSGSTSKIDSIVYTATEDGVVTLNAIAGANSTQTYFTGIVVATPVEYKETITVGADKEYATINAALNAIAQMDRPNNERVTIMIDPGNYEEMLVVTLPNVTLKNAAGDKASIELINKGVDIAENAVRITSYYGHGYSYYSMGTDCKYDEELLAYNKANGSLGFKNPGTGTTSGSYWNATVVVDASGFEADGIIFENSFNQYISKKEANDIVVMEVGNKGERPTTYGDTSVQTKSFVERAAALAIKDKHTNIYFNNCKFIGRQDTLYGGKEAVVAFNKCDVLGACDYIFGGMIAVFNECNLVMNTSDASADVAYITAAQQAGGRGYLMYNCTITSTTPGVDTASEFGSKPGYLGRPWQANTSEVVFYNTIIEAACEEYGEESLIVAAAWLSSLGGESAGMYEFGTVEKAGVDNLADRAAWSTVLEKAVLNDGTDISTKEKAFAAFLGEWNPFE